MIEINKLTKSFGTTLAVNIPQLIVKDSDIVGLAGNNGAGKTTLLRLILDLHSADSGSVLIENEDVAKSENWKNICSSYIDEGFLIEFLTPEEYFYFIGDCHGLDKTIVDSRLDAYTKLMNNEIIGKKKLIKTLSAGNKQKVGIIGSLLSNPKFLILDEPFNFLDPSSQIELVRLLKQIHAETGMTMIISSHNLEHIAECSTRLIVMEKGSVVYDIPNNDKQARETLNEYFSR